MRRVALLALLLSFAFPASALARTFAPPGDMHPDEYKYVENPDGTFTEYYQGGTGEPIQGDTYSAEGMEESARVMSEIAADEGTTGQDGSIVIGSDGDNMWAAEYLTNELATGEPYATPGEAEVGDELIDAGIADGTLPDLATVASAATGAVLTAGGIVVVGVAIGDGIDAALGEPELVEYFSGLEQKRSTPTLRNQRYFAEWDGSAVHLGQVESCEQERLQGDPRWPSSINLGAPVKEGEPPELLCVFLGVEWGGEWSYEIEHESAWEKQEGHCVESIHGYPSFYIWGGDISGYAPSPTCEKALVPDTCTAGWWQCEEYLVPGEKGKAVEWRLWATLGQAFWWGAFPSSTEIDRHASAPLAPPVPRQGAVSPITPPAKTDVPAPARHHIIEKATDKPTEKELEEKEKLGKPVHPTPLIPPIEKGAEIPSPTSPIVPTPSRSGELFPEYASKVEQAGFTVAPESYILPESAIDTSVGPNDVSDTRISPAPGTAAEPTTKIRVGVNPGDAPEPGEGHTPISGPTEPGIDFPNFGVLCKGFPFGVPCWLAQTIEGWSAASKAPKWGISSFTVEGHTIPGATFDLTKLEPIMEIVRPAMLVFATVGLVLLFYRFAKGGSPASGSGSDSSSGGSSDEGEN